MEQGPNTSAKKVWESIQAYTVRCANCSKWRLVPTKEKYEEIRERITRHPFTCNMAKEWKPEISCDIESDVKQEDGNWHWAMDKPSIPQTPNGWQRILRLRAKGGTKFVDVYYVAPSNRRFRSMVELSRYLDENPHYAREGVCISQFSFKPPVSLDENYVVRRGARSAASHDRSADPMWWIVPYNSNNVQSAGPESTTSEDVGPSRRANPRKRTRDEIESHEAM